MGRPCGGPAELVGEEWLQHAVLVLADLDSGWSCVWLRKMRPARLAQVNSEQPVMSCEREYGPRAFLNPWPRPGVRRQAVTGQQYPL
ncbi:hypothetical protein GA0115254_126742 [Streptomyces sp. Ncost-T10-10d]|nr:hypothetical protein GA0115254_126742 [Streptomyces sp. Ncost-T10-10d]